MVRVQMVRWLFALAGVYGLLVLAPQYFLEERIATDDPPAITHPEYFYGFIGTAVAFQLAFLVIALDPPRYRLLILPSIFEKFSFAIAVWILYFQAKLSVTVFVFGNIDLALGILFIIAFFLTPGSVAEHEG